MKYWIFKDASPFGKLLLTLFLMGSSYLVVSILSTLCAIPFYKVSLSEIFEILRSKDYSGNIGLLSFLQITYSAGLFLIPAILSGFLIHGRSFEYLSAKKFPAILTLFLIIMLMFITIPLNNFLVDFNMNISFPERLSGLEEKIRKAETDGEQLMNTFLAATSIRGFMVNLLMISIVPAIGEEFLFRGVLQRIFSEWFRNHHAAILVTAVLFSFFHFQFFGFLPRVFLGVLLGYLLVWTGSVWASVLAHFVNNMIAVVFFYFYNKGIITYNLDSIGSGRETFVYVLISAVLLTLVLAGIYIKETRKVS